MGQSETVIGSHAMVATGIKEENGIKYIQLKNSYADNPNEQGKVHFWFLDYQSPYESTIWYGSYGMWGFFQ